MEPDDNSTIEDVIGAISHRPRRAPPLVTVNSNSDLASTEGRAQDKEIIADLFTTGLNAMSAHFLPQHKPWLRYGWTRSMLCRGQEVQ